MGWRGVEWGGVEWRGVGWGGGRMKEGGKNIDFSMEVLKFMKKGSDYSREVLKFVEISNQKCWVYDNSQKKVIKRLSVLTMPALKYCILRGSFSEMFDSLVAIITSFGGLRTRARRHARNNHL
jgi:hypothetical protein